MTNETYEEINEARKFWKYLCIPILTASLISSCCNIVFPKKHYRKIPDNQVQENFVLPSELEIKASDQDEDGKKETILQIKGENYLLMYDSSGNPVIKKYEVVPAEKPRIKFDKYNHSEEK